jgi:hypothetical protein
MGINISDMVGREAHSLELLLEFVQEQQVTCIAD